MERNISFRSLNLIFQACIPGGFQSTGAAPGFSPEPPFCRFCLTLACRGQNFSPIGGFVRVSLGWLVGVFFWGSAFGAFFFCFFLLGWGGLFWGGGWGFGGFSLWGCFFGLLGVGVIMIGLLDVSLFVLSPYPLSFSFCVQCGPIAR